MNKSSQDYLLRFLVGGSILVLVYILSAVLPWKTLAGMFAAFPGVMAAAVILSGWRQGDGAAADTAQGSVYGMVGGLVCVIVTVLVLSLGGYWLLALAAGLVAWLSSSILLHAIVRRIREGRRS
ncbi:MAG TPA: hypothetical protein DHD79_12590 [Firmicutes bacterium]|jgi:hypothetical protein|nr:hypothetical protein [Bacillota bacterium]HAZ23035.1 hypothetical protein [Bacillota bacterium]HBL51108.1 hypothetical protein [Bacillota bacterium]HBR23369.1 hypothetical protein [Bacillota bacterium]HCM17541.1 hypothetical protein [Bacillota bacterium]